ncbi:hypothetical protein BpHYR1_026611 [Brachionus plicatilis]|uniref:Uncharacterized protein n=1 Tax=Brachionus plicatilis TaxID=10195 RepID=A0A3M7PI43_BRAPC|nr:hypothetical protein BpHYR1_026611 [Brachionus plicatilis]
MDSQARYTFFFFFSDIFLTFLNKTTFNNSYQFIKSILKLKTNSKYHFNSKNNFTCYYLYLALKIKIKFKNEFQILKFQIILSLKKS